MTKFCSIDIETTGLDPETCQILEIGAVIADTDGRELTTFHCYVKHDLYQGEAFALAMNSAILQKLDNPENLDVTEVVSEFAWWLYHFWDSPKVLFAGKNFGSFDLQFLKKLPGFNRDIKYYHAFLDPGPLYFDPKIDTTIPNLAKCLKRAGIGSVVTHTALEDAHLVKHLIQSYYSKEVQGALDKEKT